MTTPNTLGELIQFANADPLTLSNPFRTWDIVAGSGWLAPAEGLAYFGIPDLDRLEAVAQAEWGEPLTAANLLRVRGRLVRDHGITPDDADALTAGEAADAFRKTPATDLGDQLVTLDDMAVLVGRDKRTMRRHFDGHDPEDRETMPAPDVEGRAGGKPHKWRWAKIRPWLIAEFDVKAHELDQRFGQLCRVARPG